MRETYEAQRRLKAPLPGERQAPLPELAVPQGSTVARCPVSGWPTVAMPILAGRAPEWVDSSALSFLTARALEESWRRPGETCSLAGVSPPALGYLDFCLRALLLAFLVRCLRPA